MAGALIPTLPNRNFHLSFAIPAAHWCNTNQEFFSE
jgi:hypothetical protein